MTCCYPSAVRWTPLLLACALGACNSSPRNLLVRPFDAGGDAPEGGDDAPPPDAAPDADPTLGGPCTDDAQCNDNIACTYDSCDATLHRCRNVPDDTQCDDGIYCDGKEKCVLHHGCEPGPVVSCDDGNPCNIASCVESTKSCAYAPRDVDQDTDPDDHCVPHHDCNDLDPTVSSKHLEVCANGKDDNCNGVVDEMPCVQPQGDTCASAVVITAPGTYALSTLGDKKDYATSCSVTTPMSAEDLVAAVTIPPGSNQDLDVWATTQGTEVALAVESTCGQDASELACASAPGASAMRIRARNLAPGTYYVLVTTQAPASLELQVSFLAPSPPATNVDCGSAIPIAFDTPTAVSIIDPQTSLVSSCMAQTGQLTYALTVTQPSDVRVFASTTQGSGAPVVGLRAPHCIDPGDELFCRGALPPPLFARGLAPGTYVVTIAATSPIDTTLLAKAYPPTPAPPGETCATAQSATFNAVFPVDLTNNEGAIRDGCMPGGVSASFDAMLSQASDVLIVGRFPQNETGAVSFDLPACDPASAILCSPTTSTPARIGRRNVAAGDYRAVLTDQLGEVDSLEVLVRPTAAPVNVSGADLCANAVTIPSSGGFFTGDTTNASANYSSGCDSPSAPPTGANDQVLLLNLTQPRRVVFDMEGSTYTTLLDIRQGPTCPGPEVSGACFVGFGPEKSFLDLEMLPGQYWVVVDGYDGAKGAWNLDVRVLPP
jgi:hypothetical protein